uniref:Uncharacterized protein n=1 Tax=viral metagenome TaxID=1070528 RepID=A0A6H2A386_9ZZZZ
MKKSTREVGNDLEKYIVSYLQEIDPKTKQSNNSGAVSNNGDILSKLFVTECKHRNTKNLIINQKVWKKLSSQISIGSLKIPLLIMRNIDNETFVVLGFKDFINLLKGKESK